MVGWWREIEKGKKEREGVVSDLFFTWSEISTNLPPPEVITKPEENKTKQNTTAQKLTGS